MPLLYPLKRVFRNWTLFIALLVGIILASTFFASINIKANLAAKQALDQQLSSVITDMDFSVNLNITNLAFARENISNIDGVKKVDVVARWYSLPVSLSSNNYTTIDYTQMASMPNSSRIYDEWLNKPLDGIKENETYLIAGMFLADKVAIGDNIPTVIEFPTPKFDNKTTVQLNLTVAGFADLTDLGYSLISGNIVYISPDAPVGTRQIYNYNYKSDMLIISWENTLEKLWINAPNGTVATTFSIYVDRDKLLSPWDTATSANNLQTVADNIQNNVLANFEAHGTYVNSMLQNALSSFQYNFTSTLFSLILVSLPVFFVAWYLGSTVSDVSFNMRRREIGLLSTKGLSSGQIQRMFLTEALAIGLIGGALGVACGLILNQALTGGFNLDTLFSPQLFNPYTMIFTIAFGIVLALLSVFRSARKAAKLPTVEALRDYMPMESDKAYRKRWPWVAFILGTYKIAVYIAGINVLQLVQNLQFQGGNYFTVLILTPFMILDQILNYIGPLLFFWGTTKLLIQNSLKFQQLTAKVSILMGDLGALAAKNVRRSPARLAAVAFLIAFIIGYGVQVTGQLASEQDYVIRQVQYQVGADVTISVINATKAPIIMGDILGNGSGIKNATIEYTTRQPDTIVKTVDPDSWLATAYYEQEWFSGASMEQAFNDMKADNMTIILERKVAKQYNLEIGDTFGIDFPSGPRKLKVVGFFGPEPIEVDAGFGGKQLYAVTMWSFAPTNLFNMSSPFSDAYKLESFDTKILLKLDAGINGTAVAEQIRGLDLEIYGVDSFDEQWQRSQQMTNLYTYSSLQIAEIQRLGLIFVVLAASVGTVLISVVSLTERRREATLMSVRGLSYRQLVWMFLTENIAVITFSVILGVSVGLIIVYGNITSSSAVIPEIVQKRLVFSTDFIVSIASYIAMIYAATIGSILIMTRQYVTKLERMIRLR
jgi:ABC-type antimicrobial peptide transport system permease subunit